MANIDNSHQVRMETLTALHQEYEYQRNQLGKEHVDAQLRAIIMLAGIFPTTEFMECAVAFLTTDW